MTNVDRKEGSDGWWANGRRGGRGFSLVVSGPATANVTSQVVECGHCRRPLPLSSSLLSKEFLFCSVPFATPFIRIVTRIAFDVWNVRQKSKTWKIFYRKCSRLELECLPFPRSWVAVQWPCRLLLFRIFELWFGQQIPVASIHLPHRHDPPETKQKNFFF